MNPKRRKDLNSILQLVLVTPVTNIIMKFAFCSFSCFFFICMASSRNRTEPKGKRRKGCLGPCFLTRYGHWISFHSYPSFALFALIRISLRVPALLLEYNSYGFRRNQQLDSIQLPIQRMYVFPNSLLATQPTSSTWSSVLCQYQ